jgi:hypothetical protein
MHIPLQVLQKVTNLQSFQQRHHLYIAIKKLPFVRNYYRSHTTDILTKAPGLAASQYLAACNDGFVVVVTESVLKGMIPPVN